MYYLVYNKENGEMVNLAFTESEWGANAFISEKNNAVEIPEALYLQLKNNRQRAYLKNDEIVVIPKPPFQYAKWNVDTKQWELDIEYQYQSESELVREKRNKLLLEVDEIVLNPIRWAELSPEKQAEWTQYRIDLLDVPQQNGFPLNVAWPTKPS